LELFATWSRECQAETRLLNRLAAEYRGKLTIVAVSADPFDSKHKGPGTQADVDAFAQRYNVQYPVVFDPDLAVAKLYMMQGFPTLTFITRDKKISQRLQGQITYEQLDREAQQML